LEVEQIREGKAMLSLTTRRIAFFLGSGVSIPAGIPTTRNITEQVLSGEGVMRNTDGNYYFGKSLYDHMGIPDECVPRVVKFLNRIKVEIDLYYSNDTGRFTNYEDLYYITSQIYDSELGEYDNPVVQSFIDKILPNICSLLIKDDSKMREEWKLHELAREAKNYILCVVWKMLNKKPNCIDHLNSIKDACMDDQLSNIDIFTLNHDTILEQCLSQSGIQVIDGFGKPRNDVRYWDPELFDTETCKVKLFKLHGSVNWFIFRSNSGDRENESRGIPLNSNFWHTKSPQGQMQRPVNGQPMLLIGTFNKMLQYISGIYFELHHLFYRHFRHTQHLAVCGYGFGDKGINTRILEWVYLSPDKRILLIHPDPEKLKNSARGAISKRWDELINQKKLTILQKKIEETTWQDIRDSLLKVE